MKTRRSSALAKNNTPPLGKTAAGQPTPTSADKSKAESTPAENSTASKSGRATRGKRGKPSAATAEPEVAAPPESAPAPAAIDDAEASHVTPESKPARTTRRVVKRVIKKTIVKKVKTMKTDETPKIESTEDDDVVEVPDLKSMVKDEQTTENGGTSGGADTDNLAIIEPLRVEKADSGDQIASMDMSCAEESTKKQKVDGEVEGFLMRCVNKSPKEQERAATESKPSEDQRVAEGKEEGDFGGEREEKMITNEDKVDTTEELEQMITPEDKVDGTEELNQMLTAEDKGDTAEELKQMFTTENKVDTVEELEQMITTEDKVGSTVVDQEEQMINTEDKVDITEELMEQQEKQMITTEDKVDTAEKLVEQHEVQMLSGTDKSDTAEELVEQQELMITTEDRVDTAEELVEQHEVQMVSVADKSDTAEELVEQHELITSKDKVDIAEDLVEQHKEQMLTIEDKVITATELVEQEEQMSTVEEELDTEELVEQQEEQMITMEDKVESLNTTRNLVGQQENQMEPTEDEVETTEELLESQEERMIPAKNKVETECHKGDMDDYPNEEKTDFDGLLEEVDDDRIEGIPEEDAHEQAEEVLDEHAELNAAAKERKLRKELEIFVGELDRDVTKEDLKKVYQNAGEVVDVRLHKDPSTNKNKGYAFVRFANKEEASRALSEMKNPVIRGKRCVTSPSEDNDSLFVGNICNTWTKEAIKQKLKDYGVEGVEKITVVADPKREGLSRGFAFLEFSCHGEAMIAYKRLQKPDAVFGHPERSVKVAFAEPLREPDPDVMAKVKSIFVDGLPPQWDEGSVKEKFERFGEIVNVVLARNMSTAKRKDFGFVDFTSHEAAVTCVESVNNKELVDGHSKVRARVRLSNPLPKTQAIRGGMAGGFRIARSNGGSRPIIGRGSGRGENAFNRPNFQHRRGFYPPGPGHFGERGFPNERIDDPYDFNRRHNFEHGGRWGFRGAHQGSIRGPPPPNRPNFDRFRHGGPRAYDPLRGEGGGPIGGPPQPNPTNLDRFRYGGPGDYDPFRREPFPTEGPFNRPYPGRHINDRAFYDVPGHGIKRPYSMRDQDQDPGYNMEPSTRHPRFEYSGAPASFHGHRYPGAFGADGGHFHQDYYGSDYGRGVNPPFSGGHRPYGRSYRH